MCEDQVEVAFVLVGDYLGKATGRLVGVDGGLSGAFLR